MMTNQKIPSENIFPKEYLATDSSTRVKRDNKNDNLRPGILSSVSLWCIVGVLQINYDVPQQAPVANKNK